MAANSGPSGCPRCGQIDYAKRVVGIVRTDQTDFGRSMTPPPPPAPPGRRGRQGNGRLSQGWAFRFFRRWRQEPDALGPAFAMLLAVCIVWFIPSCIISERPYSTGWGSLFILCSVPAAFLLYQFLGSRSRRVKHQLRLEQTDEARERYDEIVRLWQEMEYCGRCHGVYLPGHEWQTAVNPELTLLPPQQAWGYAEQLMRYIWSFRRETVVTHKGVVQQHR
jgi:hypothetical protein